MATIIEIQDSKFEHLSGYAEKVVKYGKKLMECLSEKFQVYIKIEQRAQIPIPLLHFLHIVSTIIYILH